MRRLTRRHIICGIGAVSGSALMATSRTALAEAPLAIRGFDPVAYFTTGAPTPGLAELEYEWDEQRYRFARAEHLALFKTDPSRYAPQFAHLCAMSLARGEIIEANPEYWLVSDGKLYIFGRPAGPELFKQNLTENISKASSNRTLIPKR